ncbi:hypothetical protein ACI3L1_04775 [Deinococcus sp. SM5_A1]|uniref:hypothetical protein n=1 Tax=Deinococcus sp. SM5_A1 TaxID=3379094 RepID=UPI00385F87CB
MPEIRVNGLSVRPRRKRMALPDLGGFFMFFGVSGTDHGRAARLERRFELEHFSNVVTLDLASPLGPGQYVLRGLPHEANKRGWTVEGGGSATGHLSDDGLEELRAWMGQGNRRVQAEAIAPPA